MDLPARQPAPLALMSAWAFLNLSDDLLDELIAADDLREV
jgi:hypothetical protein